MSGAEASDAPPAHRQPLNPLRAVEVGARTNRWCRWARTGICPRMRVRRLPLDGRGPPYSTPSASGSWAPGAHRRGRAPGGVPRAVRGRAARGSA